MTQTFVDFKEKLVLDTVNVSFEQSNNIISEKKNAIIKCKIPQFYFVNLSAHPRISDIH